MEDQRWLIEKPTFKRITIVQTLCLPFCCISMYDCSCFNESLHLSPVFLSEYKEMRDD